MNEKFEQFKKELENKTPEELEQGYNNFIKAIHDFPIDYEESMKELAKIRGKDENHYLEDNKIEFENGSSIESIENIGEVTRSKRGQEYFKKIEEIYFKQLSEGDINFCTSSTTKEFTIEDINNALDKLNQLPPSPTGIEIGSKIALDILLKYIPTTKETEGISFINGISVSIVEGTDLKFNQMRLKYSDGTNKVVDVFTWNDKIVYTDIF